MDKSLDEAYQIYENNKMLREAISKDDRNKYHEKVNQWFYTLCESLKDDEKKWEHEFNEIYYGVCDGSIDRDEILLKISGDDEIPFDYKLINFIRGESLFTGSPFKYKLEKEGHILNGYEIKLDIFSTGGGIFEGDPPFREYIGVFAIKKDKGCIII